MLMKSLRGKIYFHVYRVNGRDLTVESDKKHGALIDCFNLKLNISLRGVFLHSKKWKDFLNDV